MSDFRNQSPWGTPPGGGGSGNGGFRKGPTPPFALDIAIVNFVPIIGFRLKVFGSVFAFVVSLKPTFFSSIIYHYLVFTNKDTI